MYYQFEPYDTEPFGSFETYYIPPGDKPVVLEGADIRKAWGDTLPARAAGWYWWTCYPGCLPESDPHGPFETEAEAIADANLD